MLTGIKYCVPVIRVPVILVRADGTRGRRGLGDFGYPAVGRVVCVIGDIALRVGGRVGLVAFDDVRAGWVEACAGDDVRQAGAGFRHVGHRRDVAAGIVGVSRVIAFGSRDNPKQPWREDFAVLHRNWSVTVGLCRSYTPSRKPAFPPLRRRGCSPVTANFANMRGAKVTK